MVAKLANNASSTLAGAINSSVTTVSIASGDASKFPVLAAGEWFPLTVVDASGNIEVMRVTARSGATFTVVRGQESTTARAFAAGSKCDLRMTAAAAVAPALATDATAVTQAAGDSSKAVANTEFLQAATVRVDTAQPCTSAEQGRAWANIGGSREDDDQIINGCFDIAQRGQTQSASGYGSVDRWSSDFVGGAAVQSQQPFTVGDTLGSCCKPFFGRQTVSGQSAAGHYALRVQKIEDVRSYAGQTITILGWARRSSGAGDMVVEGVQLFGGGGSPSAPVTGIGPQKVTLSSLWQPFAVTMNVPSIAGKTLGTDNKHCFAPHFWASAGANWSARALNLGLQTVGIDLFGVHIRKGVVPVEAANFYSPPKLESVIADCQRFFEAGPTDCSGVTHAGNGDTRGSLVAYSVIKRSTPVVTFSTTSITIFGVAQNGAAPNLGGAISAVRSHLNGWSIAGIANYASISAVLGGGDFAWGLAVGPTYYSDAEI